MAVFGLFRLFTFFHRIHYIVGYIGKSVRSCDFFFNTDLILFELRSAKKVGAISLKKRLKFASQNVCLFLNGQIWEKRMDFLVFLDVF